MTIMAKNLDFKLRVQGENAQAKKAINEVKQGLEQVSNTQVKPKMNFSDFAKANAEMQSMGSVSGKLAETLNKITINSGKASQVLMQTFDAKTPEKLVASLERGTAALNRMKDGAKISSSELSAGLNKALPVIQSLENKAKALNSTLNNMKISGAPAESIRKIETELFKIDSQAKRATAAFQSFSTAASNAASRVDLSIAKASGSVNGLTQNLTRSQSAFKKMQQDIANLGKNTSPLSSSISAIGGGLSSWILPAGLLTSVGMLTTELGRTQIAAERINNIFQYSFGKNASNEMRYVAELSNELGQNFEVLRESYGKFAASAESANFTSAETKSIFEGITKAGAALGMTNDEVNGSFLAVSQIASKGNVSLEELRGQLGERLPNAMGLAAKAMGVTTQELEKMIEKGLSANEFLPKFANVLNETFDQSASRNAQGLTAEINRLKNSWLELKETASGGIFNEGLQIATIAASNAVDDLKNAMGFVDSLFKNSADRAAENAAISQAAFAKHAQQLKDQSAKSAKESEEDLKKRLENSYTEAVKAAENARKATDEANKAFLASGSEASKVALMNAQFAESATIKAAENSKAAFEAVGGEIKKSMGEIPNRVAEVEASFKDLGVNIYEAMGRVTQAVSQPISKLDEMVLAMDSLDATAEEKSSAVSQAFAKMTDAAKTQADIDLIKQSIERMGQQGVLSSNDVRNALNSVGERAKKLAGETDEVTQAFDRMGLKTNEELAKAASQAQRDYEIIKNSGKASAETIESAYRNASAAAQSSGDKARIAWAETEGNALKIKDNNIALSDSFQSVGNSAYEYGEQAYSAHEKAGRNSEYVINQNKRIAKSYEEVAAASRETNPYSDNYGKLQNHTAMESGKTSTFVKAETYTTAYNKAQSLGLTGKEIEDYISSSSYLAS